MTVRGSSSVSAPRPLGSGLGGGGTSGRRGKKMQAQQETVNLVSPGLQEGRSPGVDSPGRGRFREDASGIMTGEGVLILPGDSPNVGEEQEQFGGQALDSGMQSMVPGEVLTRHNGEQVVLRQAVAVEPVNISPTEKPPSRSEQSPALNRSPPAPLNLGELSPLSSSPTVAPPLHRATTPPAAPAAAHSPVVVPAADMLVLFEDVRCSAKYSSPKIQPGGSEVAVQTSRTSSHVSPPDEYPRFLGASPVQSEPGGIEMQLVDDSGSSPGTSTARAGIRASLERVNRVLDENAMGAGELQDLREQLEDSVATQALLEEQNRGLAEDRELLQGVGGFFGGFCYCSSSFLWDESRGNARTFFSQFGSFGELVLRICSWYSSTWYLLTTVYSRRRDSPRRAAGEGYCLRCVVVENYFDNNCITRSALPRNCAICTTYRCGRFGNWRTFG